MDDQQVGKAQPEVGEQLAALGDRADDRPQVVIEQDDRRDFPRRARPALTHRDSNVGALEGRHVIDSVTRDRDDFAAALQRSDDVELLARQAAGDHVDVEQAVRGVQQEPLGKHAPVDDARRSRTQADLPRNRSCRQWMIAGNHQQPDTRALHLRHRLDHSRTHRILERE
jgi:hypothetical protein